MSAHDDEDMPPPDVAPSAPTPSAAPASTDAAAAAASPVPASADPAAAAATTPSSSSSKGPSLSRAETCPGPSQNNASDDEADEDAAAAAGGRGGLETVDEEGTNTSGGGKGQQSKPSSAVAQAIAASAALRAASAAQRPSAASMSDSPSSLHSLTKRSSVWVSLLQRSYNPPFLSPSASVLHHAGPLKKFGSKLTPSSLNGRFFHLVHHSLQYYKSNPFADPQGSIPLAGAVLTTEPETATLGLKPLPQPNCCFSLTPVGSNRTYLFVTDDPNQRTVWLELLSFSTQDAKRAALQPQTAARWNEDANLLVEGWVTKRGGDAKALSWKKRYCVYMRATHTLVYLKSAPAKAAGFVPIEKGVVVDWVGGPKQPGANPELQKHSDRTLASLPPSVDSGSILACTQSDERCYVMLAASKAERDEWVQALRGAVAYCDGVTPSWEGAKNKQARISTSAKAAAAATPASTPATPVSAATTTPAPAAATSSSAAAASPSTSASDNSRSKSESMAMDANPLLAAAAVGVGAGAVAAVAVSNNSGGSGSRSASPVITPKDAPGSGPSSAASTPAATPASTPQTKPAASPASPQASPAPSPQKVLSPSARQQSTPGPTPATSGAKATPAAGANTAAPAAAASTPNNDDDWEAATLTGVRTKGQSVSYINVKAAGVSGPSSVAGSGAPRLVRQPSRAKVVTTGSEVTVTAAVATPAAAAGAAATTAGTTTPASATTGAPVDAPPGATASAAGTAAPAAAAAADPAPVVPAAPKSTGNVMLVEKSISELYSTEATYVGVLSTICNSYILRLRKHLELGLEPRWFDDAAELAQFHIFQHAVSIRDINARLLKELEAIAASGGNGAQAAGAPTNTATATTPAATPTATPALAAAATPAASGASLPAASAVPEVSRMQHLSRIGSTFRQFIPFFKVYSSYAKSYDDVRAFEALADRRPSLKTFLALTDACESTTLSTLMITPVQRVGRYVMLLDTILKNVPRIDGVSSLDGLADVELALDEMKKVATLINETVALWEATSKVVELQSKIDAPILQPGRYLVREGVLKKTYKREPGSGFFSSLAKKEAPFVFFLLNDALLQAKKATLGEKYKSVRSPARRAHDAMRFAAV